MPLYNTDAIIDSYFKETFLYEYNSIIDCITPYMNMKRFNQVKVLDFGCGQGVPALRFALEKPKATLYGCDIHTAFNNLTDSARKQIKLSKLPKNLNFQLITNGEIPFGKIKFDLIYSWSVFEHIDITIMDKIIDNMKERLCDNGILFIQVDPFYYSANGSHLFGITEETPWIHLLLNHDDLEKALLKTTKINEPNKKFLWNEYKKLNKITANELINMFEKHGFNLLNKIIIKGHIKPSEILLNEYSEDDLITNGIILLLNRYSAKKSTIRLL